MQLFNFAIIQFLAHQRTQCAGAGLQFRVETLLHAASKLGKLDYPVYGMPSGFEFFTQTGDGPVFLSFYYVLISGGALLR